MRDRWHDVTRTMQYDTIFKYLTCNQKTDLSLQHLAVLTVPLKLHDLARHIAGHCGNIIRASVRLNCFRHVVRVRSHAVLLESQCFYCHNVLLCEKKQRAAQ